jgi:hypothetical protein
LKNSSHARFCDAGNGSAAPYFLIPASAGCVKVDQGHEDLFVWLIVAWSKIDIDRNCCHTTTRAHQETSGNLIVWDWGPHIWRSNIRLLDQQRELVP